MSILKLCKLASPMSVSFLSLPLFCSELYNSPLCTTRLKIVHLIRGPSSALAPGRMRRASTYHICTGLPSRTTNQGGKSPVVRADQRGCVEHSFSGSRRQKFARCALCKSSPSKTFTFSSSLFAQRDES